MVLIAGNPVIYGMVAMMAAADNPKLTLDFLHRALDFRQLNRRRGVDRWLWTGEIEHNGVLVTLIQLCRKDVCRVAVDLVIGDNTAQVAATGKTYNEALDNFRSVCVALSQD